MADLKGPGKVTYWYITDDTRSHWYPGLVLKIFWDGASEPSVQVPLADFFGALGGRSVDYESSPLHVHENCFMCYLPMPFAQRARFVLANEQQVKVLLDACSKKGIQGNDVSLGMIKVKDAQVPGQEAADASSKRFLVSRTITLRQRDVGLFQDMLDLLGKGSGPVKYTTYCSKSDKITRDTLIRATQAAKEKATAMATALGATLGPVLSVNEYPPKGENVPENNVVTDESSGAFGAEAEKVRITVFATFELQ